MTRFVYSPDGAAFDIFDSPPPGARAPATYRTGVTVWIPGIPEPQLLGTSGLQGWGLYPIIDSPVTCEPASYYEPEPAGYSWVLDGPLLATTTSATETRVCVLRDIEEIRELKLVELDQYALFRTFLSVRSKDAPNRWIVLDQRQRERFNSIGLVLSDRLKDRTLAKDSSASTPTTDPINTYWPRDPTIRLLKDSDGSTTLQAVTETAWGQVLKDMALYDEAIENATLTARADILAATDAATLAALDVTTYGWPPAYGET